MPARRVPEVDGTSYVYTHAAPSEPSTHHAYVQHPDATDVRSACGLRSNQGTLDRAVLQRTAVPRTNSSNPRTAARKHFGRGPARPVSSRAPE